MTNSTVQLKGGEFLSYTEKYYRHNNEKKLDIITVFREPLERCISSFFQTYGDDVVTYGWEKDITSTIIYRNSIEELQARFIRELDNQKLQGGFESIDEICDELQLKIVDLNYDLDKQHGLVELNFCRLFILRFDSLIYENFLEYVLSEITGQSIVQENANTSSSKWYRDIFKEFKASIKIPQELVLRAYESRKEIINILYPGEYHSLLTKALKKYG
ncbi:MAG: hypothetical protein VKJ64_02925 [Leptolyngbyaceae bacterium]|nr:hypothetical protein [Leptolyngbyaceae bacterium]